jgi:hypothetical protein
MTKQLLYYEHAVPVSAERHGEWSLAPRTDFEFAGHSNSVPIAATEFPAAAAEYAIVFAGSEGGVSPVAILGLKPDENLYLDETNRWDAKYIPAFARRYPFVFSKSNDGSKLVLCIDEQYGSWNQEDQGQRLFDANGERTEYLGKILNFVQDYQRQFERTQAFCQKLGELDLLQSMAVRFKLPSGDKAQLTSFMAVDREKLKALSGDTLAELARTGELELVYMHLQSLRNFDRVLARVTGDESMTESWNEVADSTSEKLIH